jgi:hypothetical protein
MLDTGLSFKEVYFTVMKPKNKRTKTRKLKPQFHTVELVPVYEDEISFDQRKEEVQLLIVKMFKDAGYFDKRRRTQKPEALD